LTLAEMIDDFRNHLDAVGDNFFAGAEVCQRLHAAQQEILRQITRQDPSFYVTTYDLSLTANTNLYNLPLNARLGSRIIFTENRQGSLEGTEIPPADLRDYFSVNQPGIINLTQFYKFIMQGNQVRIEPTPSSSTSNALRLWYIPTFGNMIQGRPSAVDATSLTMFTTTPNYTSNYGVIDRRDDFYNGMTVEIIAGTGIGQVRTITDYTGSTRVLTVDTWTTNPDTSGDNISTFLIKCPVPEDHHHLVSLRAAMIGAIKNRNRMTDLQEIYFGRQGSTIGALYELLNWIAKRQEAAPNVVSPVDMGH